MKYFHLILSFLFALNSLAQPDLEQVTDSILKEANQLYYSEMASWYGTDIFLEKHKDRSDLQGYFSYMKDGRPTCIFYSKSLPSKVIGTIGFDSTYNIATAIADLAIRDFTAEEMKIYAIRVKALDIISNDTLFKFYSNTDLNLIPLINGNERKIYVLTGPQKSGLVIFGNDYLLTFDKNNELLEKKALHKNIIVADYNQKTEDGNLIVGQAHIHLPGTSDFITVTDLCTLMLYGKFTSWETYSVLSDTYYSQWSIKNRKLLIITREAFKKISEDKKEN